MHNLLSRGYMKLQSEKGKLVIRGCIRGITAVVIGSALFTIGDALLFVSRGGFTTIKSYWFWLVLLSIFIGVIVLTSVPAILGAVWLAFDLYKKRHDSEPTPAKVFYKGALIGLLIWLGLFGFVMITYVRRGDWSVILFQAVLTMVICSFVAGQTALWLKKDISIMAKKSDRP